MQGKRNDVSGKKVALAENSARAGGYSSRPDLVIPCRVARQQSPTPFHQAKTVYTTLIAKSAVPNIPFALHASENAQATWRPVFLPHRVLARSEAAPRMVAD
jgi:hypothetical protein